MSQQHEVHDALEARLRGDAAAFRVEPGAELRGRLRAALAAAPAPVLAPALRPALRPALLDHPRWITAACAAGLLGLLALSLQRRTPEVNIDAPLLLSSLSPARAQPWMATSRDALRNALDAPLQAEIVALSLDATRVTEAWLANLPGPVRRLAAR